MEVANWKNTFSIMSGQLNWHSFVIFYQYEQQLYSEKHIPVQHFWFWCFYHSWLFFLSAFMGLFFHKGGIILFFHPLHYINYFWNVDPNFKLIKYCIWSVSSNVKTGCTTTTVSVFVLRNVLAILHCFAYCHYFVVTLVAENY